MTTKRLANIRSDFLSAARVSGLIPIGAWYKGASLAPTLYAPQTETSAPGPHAPCALCDRPRNRPGGGQRWDGCGFHRRRSCANPARHPEHSISAGHAYLERGGV
jgi:hypothetical protein